MTSINNNFLNYYLFRWFILITAGKPDVLNLNDLNK